MTSHVILPSTLSVVSENETSGQYEINGLYPGYGHTFGNAIRRMMLSSIPGVSVSGIRIKGVSHEFETIPGVLEDVMTILLNLRKTKFRIAGEAQKILTLSVKGKKKVKALNIKLPGEVTVLNPEQTICEITDPSKTLEMDIIIDFGIGFVPREEVLKDKISSGYIALDAVFTPIRKASYEVEDMRVGNRTDYNRLRLNIETDGTISPREALDSSIRMMIDQMSAILKLEINSEIVAEQAIAMRESLKNESMARKVFVEEEIPAEETQVDLEVQKNRIDAMGFSVRTERALDDAGIRTIGGLIKKSEQDLLALAGFGDKSLEEVQTKLNEYDLSLKKSQK